MRSLSFKCFRTFSIYEESALCPLFNLCFCFQFVSIYWFYRNSSHLSSWDFVLDSMFGFLCMENWLLRVVENKKKFCRRLIWDLLKIWSLLIFSIWTIFGEALELLVQDFYNILLSFFLKTTTKPTFFISLINHSTCIWSSYLFFKLSYFTQMFRELSYIGQPSYISN